MAIMNLSDVKVFSLPRLSTVCRNEEKLIFFHWKEKGIQTKFVLNFMLPLILLTLVIPKMASLNFLPWRVAKCLSFFYS